MHIIKIECLRIYVRAFQTYCSEAIKFDFFKEVNQFFYNISTGLLDFIKRCLKLYDNCFATKRLYTSFLRAMVEYTSLD